MTHKQIKHILSIGIVLLLFMVLSGHGWAAQEAKEININTAPIEELVQLKGIGPTYAQRIVEYREKHERFQSPDEIKKVPGIGEKTWQDNKDKIVVE